MILFSDLHLDKDSADVCLNQVLPGIAEAALNSDRLAVFLGDWWHLRYRIDVRLQVAVLDTLRAWASKGIRLKFLVGNHDQVDINGRNALEVFDSLPNVDVYSVPTIEGDFVWLPYRKNLADYEPMHPYFADRTVFLHQTIQGARGNEGYVAENGVILDPFVGARVFAGHFHKRQEVHRGGASAWYVGSPRQVTAGESGQVKGYGVLEGDCLVEWVDTNWGPKFHRLELQEGQKFDWSGVSEGDDVRVVVPDEYQIAQVGAELDKLGVTHTVTPKIRSAESRCSLPSDAGIRQYAEAWVKERDEDPKRLLPVFDSLVGGTYAD